MKDEDRCYEMVIYFQNQKLTSSVTCRTKIAQSHKISTPPEESFNRRIS